MLHFRYIKVIQCCDTYLIDSDSLPHALVHIRISFGDDFDHNRDS